MKRASINLELDEDGEWTAHCVELPGCTWWAPDKEEAVGLASEVVAAFCSWLNAHGEEEVLPPIKSFRVLEEGRGRWTVGDYFADHTFNSDLQPAGRSEVDSCLRWLGYSRSDLLTLVNGLDEGRLKIPTGPPGRVLSIASMLQHIADVEWWYLHNIGLLSGARPPSVYARGGLGYLSSIRDVVSNRLKLTSDKELERTVTSSTQEQWTLRKVLRRLIWHERYHAAAIESGLRRGSK